MKTLQRSTTIHEKRNASANAWRTRAGAAALSMSMTACGSRVPPSPTHAAATPASTASAAESTPPSDTQPYGYEFAPVSPESIKTDPPAASLPTGPGGRLFPEAISGVVRTHFDEITQCYEAARKKNARLAGIVQVKSSFGRDGIPMTVADQGSTLPDKGVVDCVLRVFRALRYPTSRGGTVTFVYPIKLGS